MNKHVQRLMTDINQILDTRRTTLEFLAAMGYRRTKKHLAIKAELLMDQGVKSYILFELVDEDRPEKEVSFSFLFDCEAGDGFVAPYPFSRYNKA